MTSLAPTLNFVDFQYHPDLGMLLGQWRRPVSGLELRRSYEAALAAALPTCTRYWLLDLRLRGLSTKDDTQWVLTQFVPSLAPRLGGRVYIAFVGPASQLRPEEHAAGSLTLLDDIAHVRLFADQAAALAWLASRQQHDSA